MAPFKCFQDQFKRVHDDQRAGIQFPVEEKIFLSSTDSRPAIGPTQSPRQWETRTVNPGVTQPTRDGMTIYKMGEDGGEVIHVINYVIKHYTMKAHGGVDV
jgi:hypothetical protein